ncbi:unnamed protein product [Linum trigynum]|uniref:Uncharacterized protein n=1 Tax=Linum trigynum TaxID=586398 RepID=A0AAV2GJI6_9ROSI
MEGRGCAAFEAVIGQAGDVDDEAAAVLNTMIRAPTTNHFPLCHHLDLLSMKKNDNRKMRRRMRDGFLQRAPAKDEVIDNELDLAVRRRYCGCCEEERALI